MNLQKCILDKNSLKIYCEYIYPNLYKSSQLLNTVEQQTSVQNGFKTQYKLNIDKSKILKKFTKISVRKRNIVYIYIF